MQRSTYESSSSAARFLLAKPRKTRVLLQSVVSFEFRKRADFCVCGLHFNGLVHRSGGDPRKTARGVVTHVLSSSQ